MRRAFYAEQVVYLLDQIGRVCISSCNFEKIFDSLEDDAQTDTDFQPTFCKVCCISIRLFGRADPRLADPQADRPSALAGQAFCMRII